jgi:lipoyl synthase
VVAAEAVAAPLSSPSPLPSWIRIRPPAGAQYEDVKRILGGLGLETVCREARCPNLPECWSAGTATLMLLGAACTRRCSFCAVTTHWPRGVVDESEPDRVARAVAAWGLRYVVLTQVCRDDLPDGGARILAETVRQIRSTSPSTKVELLAGDLGGDPAALATALRSPPDVFAHNLETVRSLSTAVRDPRAGYDRSLDLLRAARRLAGPRQVLKSSIMVGLGETDEELERALVDLRDAGVDLLTLGQYLRPSAAHRPVRAYLPPEGFARWKTRAEALGFAGVEAGPLVRSSYHAEELFDRATAARGA